MSAGTVHASPAAAGLHRAGSSHQGRPACSRGQAPCGPGLRDPLAGHRLCRCALTACTAQSPQDLHVQQLPHEDEAQQVSDACMAVGPDPSDASRHLASTPACLKVPHTTGCAHHQAPYLSCVLTSSTFAEGPDASEEAQEDKEEDIFSEAGEQLGVAAEAAQIAHDDVARGGFEGAIDCQGPASSSGRTKVQPHFLIDKGQRPGCAPGHGQHASSRSAGSSVAAVSSPQGAGLHHSHQPPPAAWLWYAHTHMHMHTAPGHDRSCPGATHTGHCGAGRRVCGEAGRPHGPCAGSSGWGSGQWPGAFAADCPAACV